MNTYESGCEAGNQIGFYYEEARDDMYVCYVTEGEKKGIYGNEILHAPFVSIPGVSSWGFLLSKKGGERPVDLLKRKGVRIFIVAFDADRETNERVMQAQKATIQALKEEGFTVQQTDFSWLNFWVLKPNPVRQAITESSFLETNMQND